MFPLKTVNPNSISSSKSPYLMGNLADLLPKSGGSRGSSGGYNSSSGTSTVKARQHFCLVAGGFDESGSTTELEGLAPPPVGVTASSAKSKGIETNISKASARARREQHVDPCTGLQEVPSVAWLKWLPRSHELSMFVGLRDSLTNTIPYPESEYSSIMS
ncbi:hypothetical protein V6N12_033576 [Hibiscus sabdariffa]|uniref:Uncharacterized protein n=1 Tax=Hibiscus sabdariffa TaxID=183260 RepID=A0ABR2BWH7_9ROSI